MSDITFDTGDDLYGDDWSAEEAMVRQATLKQADDPAYNEAEFGDAAAALFAANLIRAGVAIDTAIEMWTEAEWAVNVTWLNNELVNVKYENLSAEGRGAEVTITLPPSP